MNKIHLRKIVTVERAYGDIEDWRVCERKDDGMWIGHKGDVYSPKQLDRLIIELKKLQSYIRKRKRQP